MDRWRVLAVTPSEVRDARRTNGGLTNGRARHLTSDERLAIALHDLDAVNHYGRCSFARLWAATRHGERYEDNPMGCIGLNRTSRDRKRHFEDWLARVEPARRVAAELGIADILLGTPER